MMWLRVVNRFSKGVLTLSLISSLFAVLCPSGYAEDITMQSLTLKEAIDLARQHNLQLGLSMERVQMARAALELSRSALGPHVALTASQANLSTNLRAQGFPNIPQIFPSPVQGPFNSFDTRLSLTQTVFNPLRSHLARSSEGQLAFVQHQERAFLDQIIAATALAYIEAQQKSARLEAAQANLRLSEELAELARDQQKAGIATGVDVARSETRVAQDQYLMSQAKNQHDESLIRLKRVMGLPSQSTIQLTSPITFHHLPIPDSLSAMVRAASQREELKALQSQVMAAEEALNAADSEALPEVGLQAAIGPSGVNAGQSVYTTKSIAIGMSIPLFTSGELSAHHSKAKSEFNTVRIQHEDAQRQVEEDVALALLSLHTSEEQVAAAKKSLDLAERLLDLSRDRFKAGVTDNLEVVDALTALATARSRLIDATAEHTSARVNAAAAMGEVARFEI
jgi:outer membrane protein TolC